jgi:hypothetical protein
MSVLSFRKSVEQLDQALDQANQKQVAMQRILSRCITSAGEYSIELKSEDKTALRNNLERLSNQTKSLLGSSEADRLANEFRGALRAYSELAQAEVTRMRTETVDVMESMQTFIVKVLDSGTNQEQILRQEFEGLEAKALTGEITAIRAAIRHAGEVALKSCEDIQRSQGIVIAQLEDEIRHLHQVVDHEHRAALSDPTTGVWNRAKLDGRIKDLILLNEGFCVFLVGLPNLAQIARSDPRIAAGLLRALAGRLQSISGKNGEIGMAGRWNEETFAIVFNLPLSGAPTTPASAEAALSGTYSIQHDGAASDIEVPVHVRAVERPKDSQDASFYLQLGQAVFNVTAR